MKLETITAEQTLRAEVFRERMLKWSNPVEYVNNMYGCHPGDGRDGGDRDYFDSVFS